MTKLWFKAKRYGWGWYPVTWQGWSITLVYAVLLALEVGRLSNYVIGHQGEPFFALVMPVLFHVLWAGFLIGSLLYICIKTGEKPEWNWSATDRATPPSAEAQTQAKSPTPKVPK